MGTIRVKAERDIATAPDVLYGYIADNREHHQNFLPEAFSNFQVESGGVGAGTITRFRITAGGRSREYRMVVAEPEPGRVLTESDSGSTLVTTFTVSPHGGGARVQIATTWEGAGGVGGFFERLFAPRVLRKIYEEELARLDTYAREQRT
jgi:Polyketide cyclase / dehydrase and lipid transport